MKFAQRLRTVRLDPEATPTRTRRNYYDQEAVAAVFGDQAEERMDDETEGRGPVYRRDGGLWQKDRSGELVRVGGEGVEGWLGEEGDP